MGGYAPLPSGRGPDWLDLSSMAAMVALPVALFTAIFLGGCRGSTPPQSVAEPLADARIVRSAGVMGTTLDLEVLAANRSTALAASEAALQALEATEARLSTWRDDSELARLNAHPVGERFELSPELDEVLRLAFECTETTRGAFDPTVGPLVDAWGLRRGGAQPTLAQIELARARVGPEFLKREPGSVVKYLPLRLEEAAFGKGRGLDLALAAAARAGAAGITLDLGGQISRRPAPGESDRWVALAHPADREKIVAEIRLGEGSMATSGNGEHGIVVDGKRLGHLLDPRTGRPVADFGSLTVLAPEGMEADCLSTGLYVLGPQAALRFAAITPTIEVIVVNTEREAPRVWASAGVELRTSPAFLGDGAAP